MTARDHEVVIIGGGPGATASALYLLRRGIRPLLVERERFPRYHIGESLTGECGNCLRDLGLEPYMNASDYPIKHGVTVWGPGGRNAFWVPVMRRSAAGALEAATTWQVRRADFDDDLLRHAIARGAQRLEATAREVIREGGRVTGIVAVTPAGESIDLRADIVVDASGQAAFFASRGVSGPTRRGRYARQVAVFGQVTGAVRDEGAAGGNTLIFYRKKHHWAWFIPLSDTVTSVGVVVPSDYYRERGRSADEFLKQEIMDLNPELTWRIRDTTWVEAGRTASNYSYRVEAFTGKGFLSVGDSHCFTDPIFSFGVYLAMKEAEFAADAIAAYLEGTTRHLDHPFAEYERRVSRGQRLLQDLIDCFWEFPLAFQRMAHQTHPDDIIDCFAGRIYAEEERLSDGILSMRRLLARRLDQAPGF